VIRRRDGLVADRVESDHLKRVQHARVAGRIVNARADEPWSSTPTT
jgi:hypothetical protein